MKNKTKILLLILFLVALTVFTAYIITRQEEDVQLIDMDKFWYGVSLQFEYRMIMDGHVFSNYTIISERIQAGAHLFDPSYTELIFVHNAEQAQDLPDNIIAAWPRETHVEGMIARIHWTLENPRLRDGLPLSQHATLEEVGLSYPLTAADLVDNWKNVYALWQTIHYWEQLSIQDAAPLSEPSIDE